MELTTTKIISFLTLVVIYWYTWETRKMQIAVTSQSKEMVRQTRLSIMPAFTVRLVAPTFPKISLINVGNGTAINIEVERLLLPSTYAPNGDATSYYYFDKIAFMRPNDEVALTQHLHTSIFRDQFVDSLTSLWRDDENRFYELVVKFQDLEGSKHSQNISIGLKSSRPSPVKSSD
ncbi:MAG: hypothetical protein AB7P14_25220 [Blastocatellales bacterium]